MIDWFLLHPWDRVLGIYHSFRQSLLPGWKPRHWTGRCTCIGRRWISTNLYIGVRIYFRGVRLKLRGQQPYPINHPCLWCSILILSILWFFLYWFIINNYIQINIINVRFKPFYAISLFFFSFPEGKLNHQLFLCFFW